MVESPAITWSAPDAAHPARRAAQRSAAAVAGGDKQGWLALFADDAVVEDPVGPSAFDPAGDGHRGRERIAAFWDAAIAPVRLFHFTVTDSFAAGEECANVGTITSVLDDGTRIDAEGVFVYRVGPDGLIRSLRAFWELDRAMATARPYEGDLPASRNP